MASTLLRLCALGLLAAVTFGGPAVAAEPLASPNIIKVQAGGGDNQDVNEQAIRRNQRHSANPSDWRALRGSSDSYFDYRSDWRDRRDRNDWVAPAVGFLGGLAVGGALANSPPPPAPYMAPIPPYAASPPYGSNPHVDWCLANHPGYNPYDNTYEAYYGGPRYYCRSPYGG